MLDPSRGESNYIMANRLHFLFWLLAAGMLFLLPGEGMAGSHGYSYRFDYFGRVDSDGDGGISWWEYRRYFPDPKIEVFALADENGDGFIDRYEWAQAIERFGYYFEDPPGSGSRHPDRPTRKNRRHRPY